MIEPQTIIAKDYYSLEDALNKLQEYGKIKLWSDLTDEEQKFLVQKLSRMIKSQGYPDFETFGEMCLIAYKEIK